MKRALVVTEVADTNIDDQLIELAKRNPESARRFLSALYDNAFPALLELPEMGTRWRSSKPSLSKVRWRSVPGFPKHMIFYRPTNTTVEILWVLYGPRDLPPILGDQSQ